MSLNAYEHKPLWHRAGIHALQGHKPDTVSTLGKKSQVSILVKSLGLLVP